MLKQVPSPLEKSSNEMHLQDFFNKLKQLHGPGELKEALTGIKRLYHKSPDKFLEEAWAISNSSIRFFRETYLVLFSRLEGLTHNSPELSNIYHEVKDLLKDVEMRMELRTSSILLFNSVFRASKKKLLLNEAEVQKRITQAVESGNPVNIIALWSPRFNPSKKAFSPNKDELLWLVTSLKASRLSFKLTIVIQDIYTMDKEDNSLKQAVCEIESFIKSCADDRICTISASTLISGLSPPKQSNKYRHTIRSTPQLLESIKSEILNSTPISDEEAEKKARTYIYQIGQLFNNLMSTYQNAVYVATAPVEHAPLYNNLPIAFIETKQPPSVKDMRTKVWHLLNELRHISSRREAVEELVLLAENYPETFAQALKTMPAPSYDEVADAFVNHVKNKGDRLRRYYTHEISKEGRQDAEQNSPDNIFVNTITTERITKILEEERPKTYSKEELGRCLSKRLLELPLAKKDKARLESYIRTFMNEMSFISTKEKREAAFGPLLKIVSQNVPEDLAERLRHSFKLAEDRIAQMTATDILQVFMQKRYHKDSPINEDGIIRNFTEKIMNGKPLEFIFFWGAFKESQAGVADAFDHAALKTLYGLHKKISKIYTPPPDSNGKQKVNKITIIFTDAFAENINGKDKKAIEQYYRSLKSVINSMCMFGESPFELKRISTLYPVWAKSGGQKSGFEEFVKAAAQASARINSNPDIFARFITMAQKHSTLVANKQMSAVESAKIYLAIRTWENQNLPTSSIIISLGENVTERIFSDSPTLFIFPYKSGMQTPWFSDAKNPPKRFVKDVPAQSANIGDVMQRINDKARGLRGMVGFFDMKLNGRQTVKINDVAFHAQQEFVELKKWFEKISGVGCGLSYDELNARAFSTALLCVYGDIPAAAFYDSLIKRIAKINDAYITKEIAFEEVDDLRSRYAIFSMVNVIKALRLLQITKSSRNKSIYARISGVLNGLSDEAKAVLSTEFPTHISKVAKEDVLDALMRKNEEVRKPMDASEAMVSSIKRNILAELLIINNITPKKSGFNKYLAFLKSRKEHLKHEKPSIYNA